MKNARKSISILLVLTIVLSINISVFADFIDTNTHWANKEIGYLAEKEILNGYPNGTFKPQNNVTRAEVYKIINTLMGYTEESNVSFLDVKKGDWFYQDVARGVKAGYINANIDMDLKPNIPATRQEVARIIGIAFGLSKYESNSAKSFLDEKMISEHIKGYISILKDKGYIAGYPDGNFRPDGLITRAEVSKMIKNISGEILIKPGTLSKDIEGNLLIATDGVILKNMTIRGDIYLTQKLGSGSLVLNNVIVEGNIIDRNDAVGSVKLDEKSVIDKEKTNIKIDPLEDEKVKATSINPKETLAASKLIGSFKNKFGEKVSGKLDWTIPTTVEKGSDLYDWTFTPDDINTYNIISGKVIVNVNPTVIVKTDPIVDEKVTATSIDKGESLADSKLSGSFKNQRGQRVTGSLEWSRPTPIEEIRAQYDWTFTPDDLNTYNIISGRAVVIVNPTFTSKTDPIEDEKVKATPINRGQTIEDSKLSGSFKNSYGNNIPGSLEWDRQRGDGVRSLYTWKFTPRDSAIYNTIRGRTTVIINEVETPNINGFAGGIGTLTDPYKVSTANQLDKVRDYLDSHFIQTADINLAVNPYNAGKGWVPIGNESDKFRGTYNGNDYKITGLTINGNENNQGLFGCTSGGAVLSNIGLVNITINGKYQIGGLASKNMGIIEKCYAKGSVIGDSNVGILVGLNMGIIEKSYSTGLVIGFDCVGGLVGSVWAGGSIKTSYSNAQVKGNTKVGGLIGELVSIIENSYATGSVKGVNRVGGLVGQSRSGAIIEYSYAAGLVEATNTSGKTYIAGIVGYNDGKVNNCYYDKETTGRDDKGKGNPKKTIEMTKRVTFEKWPFNFYWDIDSYYNSYPYLKWQGTNNIPYP